MLDRKTPPPFVRSTSFDLINPTKLTLSNGSEVQLIPGGDQDVIKVEFIFNAGRWQEPAWGISHFTSSLLTKGTKNKTSFDIAQIFDQYGAHIEVSPGLDHVTLSLYTLTKNLETVLQLLIELLTQSIFPEKELEQSKVVYLQNLKINNEKTSFLASKLIRKSIFGDQHPYGKELDEHDVTKLNRDQLSKYYDQFFSDFFVMISGKISPKSEQLITERVSSLKVLRAAAKTNLSRVEAKAYQYEEKDGSVQTSIRMGKKSLMRTDADYVDVLFVNHILGGYFGSRLMKNIREEKGLTYGIYSSLHSLKNGSYLVIGADVNKENRDLTFEEIRKELKRLRTEKIGEEELDTARYHFIGGLQAEIITPFAHADKIKTILLYNLNKHHYQNMISRINSVSADELMNTVEKYFNESSFLEVAAG